MTVANGPSMDHAWSGRSASSNSQGLAKRGQAIGSVEELADGPGEPPIERGGARPIAV